MVPGIEIGAPLQKRIRPKAPRLLEGQTYITCRTRWYFEIHYPASDISLLAREKISIQLPLFTSIELASRL